MSTLTRRHSADVESELRSRVAKLERINAALMAHVERATDQHEGAYSLFQTAIMLEGRVRSRTEELTALMRSLERSNAALKSAKDEAEHANRSKTRFLAAASHDLLQPLNATRLSTSALVGMVLSDDARTIAGQVERGLQTIEDVIKTLLDISKLDAGVVRPDKKAVRLAPVMSDIAESFQPLAEAKALRFTLRCADIAATTDVVLLKRIIQNLVSNAVRYTKSGGIMIAARARRGDCVIDVVDTGPGIPDSERDLVFEEFYRGRGAGASDGGLGLGLSIVRRMAAALEHRIEVQSNVGRGSRFRLILPLADHAVEEIVTSGHGGSFFAGAHVLIIENDRATQTALTRLLQSWSLRVTTLTEIAEWHRGGVSAPDIILADYHLDNGAVGLDAVAEIRAGTAVRLPAIVMTADHSEAVEACVLEARCELVRKPVKPAQLRSLLSFLIDRAKAAAAE